MRIELRVELGGDRRAMIGLTTPLTLLILAFLLLGFVAIGLSFSAATIVATRRGNSEFTAGQSHAEIDVSTAFLAVSALLPLLAGVLSRFGASTAALMLLPIGPLLLWPISAVLAIRGKGAGRRVLLVGHGLIALLVALLILIPVFVYIGRG
jgi:hypothetical protein